MRSSSVVAATLVGVVLLGGFGVMVPKAPGIYVLVLVAGTFGAGPLYGAPTPGLMAHPWRRDSRVRRVAAITQVQVLAWILDEIGWNQQVRGTVRLRSDLAVLRRESTCALLSHTISAAFHGLAALGLMLTGASRWALVALVLGALIHAWPALLQVHVLGRLDEVQSRLDRTHAPMAGDGVCVKKPGRSQSRGKEPGQ